MEIKKELELIKEAQQAIAGLEMEKKKIFDEVVKQIDPSPKLESTLWDFMYNGIQCYRHDIKKMLEIRQDWLDSSE